MNSDYLNGCTTGIYFQNLKGFDLKSSYLLEASFISRFFTFIIFQGEFEFYMSERNIRTCEDFFSFNITEPNVSNKVNISMD